MPHRNHTLNMKTIPLILFLGTLVTAAPAVAPNLNILFITADDMNYDTPGFAGSRVSEITPNLDPKNGG